MAAEHIEGSALRESPAPNAEASVGINIPFPVSIDAPKTRSATTSARISCQQALPNSVVDNRVNAEGYYVIPRPPRAVVETALDVRDLLSRSWIPKVGGLSPFDWKIFNIGSVSSPNMTKRNTNFRFPSANEASALLSDRGVDRTACKGIEFHVPYYQFPERELFSNSQCLQEVQAINQTLPGSDFNVPPDWRFPLVRSLKNCWIFDHNEPTADCFEAYTARSNGVFSNMNPEEIPTAKFQVVFPQDMDAHSTLRTKHSTAPWYRTIIFNAEIPELSNILRSYDKPYGLHYFSGAHSAVPRVELLDKLPTGPITRLDWYKAHNAIQTRRILDFEPLQFIAFVQSGYEIMTENTLKRVAPQDIVHEYWTLVMLISDEALTRIIVPGLFVEFYKEAAQFSLSSNLTLYMRTFNAAIQIEQDTTTLVGRLAAALAAPTDNGVDDESMDIHARISIITKLSDCITSCSLAQVGLEGTVNQLVRLQEGVVLQVENKVQGINQASFDAQKIRAELFPYLNAILVSFEKQIQSIQKSLETLRTLKKEAQEQRSAIVAISSLYEASASRMLGENVKRLTYTTIFYLPPTLAATLFSINEMFGTGQYGFAVVCVVLSLATYLIVFAANQNWFGRTWTWVMQTFGFGQQKPKLG